jgi:catechol 2,3-dioxygenase-like lactoylglutathione lyase family enzyme
MLHHLSFAVADLARSSAFYDAALGALGYVRVWEDTVAVGYGLPGCGDKFAIKLSRSPVASLAAGFHLAFAAPSRQAVLDFHAAALQHGGQDNGVPELCPEYGPSYYAGFVIDPDGYRIEAVISTPPEDADADSQSLPQSVA